MYNDPTLTLKSRVFAISGPPFDVVVTLHPIGEKHHLLPESFQNKYTDSHREMDKLKGNLSASGEGVGSYSGGTIKSFLKSNHDFYTYMSLEDGKWVMTIVNHLIAINLHL